ncbi:MAG: beta-ketoacyl-ACP synthase III [Kofleriaceae bacterium]
MSEFRSRILGVGGYVPPRVVTNHDLAQMFETSHEWIVERTGIEERRWVEPGEGGAEMAAKAATQAMERAGVGAADIDLLIYATLSPDVMFPGTGVFTQRLLGLRQIPCYDIRQQCSGFIYALAMADAFIKSGQYKHVLVIGSEVHSTGLDISTAGRDVTVLFGDGAGAMVLGRATDDAHVILSTHLHADGTDAEILWTEAPASRNHPRLTHADVDGRKIFPAMQGQKVFKHAVTKMPMVIKEALDQHGLVLSDVDMLIPHQANLRINQMIAKMIGLPEEKMHNNIQKLGNTTAATIPLCMNDAIALGKVKPGDLVCMVAFGAGLTWASALLRY